MNIVLIGYRCSGKTTAGKALARQLRRGFLDTDAMIERRAGCSIEEMVSIEGWDHFRRIEKGVIREISSIDCMVIATGGGAVVDEENVKNLKKNGWLVWLDGTLEVLRKRMVQEESSGRGRPSLTGLDPLEEIRRVLMFRIPFYEKAKDYVVDTSVLSTQGVTASIVESLPERLRENGDGR